MAQTKGYRKLSNYFAPWQKVLNAVEQKTFEDLRYWGIPLYPRYPISGEQYLHFANPFEKVGIEIVFKNSPQLLIDRKVALLEASGWVVYTIKSSGTYYPIDHFFKITRKDKWVKWEELSDRMRFLFTRKYHTENTACLVYYINVVHFQKRDENSYTRFDEE